MDDKKDKEKSVFADSHQHKDTTTNILDNIVSLNTDMVNNEHTTNINETKRKTAPFITINRSGIEVFNYNEFLKLFTARYTLIAAKPSENVEAWTYIYNNGRYARLIDSDARGLIRDLILEYELDCKGIWITDSAKQLKDKLSTTKKISINDFDNYPNLICFRNGVYNLETGELEDHTSNRYFTIQVNCDYHKTSSSIEDTTYFYHWIKRLVNDDSKKIETILQFIGLTISNIEGYLTKKGLFLIGAGNTGKSFVFKIIEHILGDKNVQVVDFNELDDNFVSGSFLHRRLIGHSDSQLVNHVSSVTNFKCMTGGDSIAYDQKFEARSSFRYKGTMLFVANRIPRIKGDLASHTYERMLIVKSSDIPVPNEERDPKLLDLIIQNDIEIVISLALEALQRLINNNYKYTIPDDYKTIIQEMKEENDIVLQFLKDAKECDNGIDDDNKKTYFVYHEGSRGIVSKTSAAETYNQFRDYCSDNGYTALNKGNFLLRVKELGFETAVQTMIDKINARRLRLKCSKDDWDNPHYSFTQVIKS